MSKLQHYWETIVNLCINPKQSNQNHRKNVTPTKIRITRATEETYPRVTPFAGRKIKSTRPPRHILSPLRLHPRIRRRNKCRSVPRIGEKNLSRARLIADTVQRVGILWCGHFFLATGKRGRNNFTVKRDFVYWLLPRLEQSLIFFSAAAWLVRFVRGSCRLFDRESVVLGWYL